VEIIKSNIRDNEILKWEKFSVIDYRKKIMISFVIAISLISVLMILIGLFFWYVPSWDVTFFLFWTDIVVPPINIYIMIVSIFVSLAIFAIAYAIKWFKRGLRRLALKLSDLRLYQQIHILTNERWIQKDYRSLVNLKDDTLPIENFSEILDLVFIDLKNITKATVSRFRSNYILSFQFKPIFGLDQNLTFDVRLKLDHYLELKNILNQIIPLEILKE
jgi:hypothetical protein